MVEKRNMWGIFLGEEERNEAKRKRDVENERIEGER